MKKKRSLLSLPVMIGICIAIGYIAKIWDALSPAIPFEREWIIYAALFILLGMSVRIGQIWSQSKKTGDPTLDIDEQNGRQEKIAHQFIGTTSLVMIAATSVTLIAFIDRDQQTNLLSTLSAFFLFSILLFSIFAQQNAVKFHNKYSPGAFVNIKKSDDYEEHFKNLDEGEKFEQYRVAYSSFYAMNLLFPMILMILFIISIATSSPQYVAILAVGILWFVMYMIYYREGAKSH